MKRLLTQAFATALATMALAIPGLQLAPLLRPVWGL